MTHGLLLLRLAWRNLWRRPHRTMIILLAVALGIWSMLTISALIRGMSTQYVEQWINQLTGHVLIHAPGYRQDPVIDYRMPVADAELETALNQQNIIGWTQRLRIPAVINSERESAGVTMVGIIPQQENGLSFIAQAVRQGRMLHDENDRGIVLGLHLAKQLETRIGKRVVLMTQDSAGNVAERGFKVVGLYRSRLQDTEKQFAFVGLKVMQKLLKVEGQVSEISLRSDALELLPAILKQLQQLHPQLDIVDWKTSNPLLNAMISMLHGFLMIWFVVVFIAVAFGLINTLLMAIFERSREMGLLRALGMQPRLQVLQILLESLFLLLLGALLGNLLSGLTLLLTAGGLDFSRFAQGYEMIGLSSRIYPVLQNEDWIMANLLVLGLGLLASFYPAWRASRMSVLKALGQG